MFTIPHPPPPRPQEKCLLDFAIGSTVGNGGEVATNEFCPVEEIVVDELGGIPIRLCAILDGFLGKGENFSGKQFVWLRSKWKKKQHWDRTEGVADWDGEKDKRDSPRLVCPRCS